MTAEAGGRAMDGGGAEQSWELRLLQTSGAVGYFSPVPFPEPELPDAWDHILQHPNDDFMRRFLLRRLQSLPLSKLQQAAGDVRDADPVRHAVYLDAWMARITDTEDGSLPSRAILDAAAPHSPWPTLRGAALPDARLHQKWMRYFIANLGSHRSLPAPSESGLPHLWSPSALEPVEAPVPVEQARSRLPACVRQPTPAPCAEEVAGHAIEQLGQAGIRMETEMRHHASLSPIALQRSWRMSTRVCNGHHRYRLFGTQTSYGRGLELESARAGLYMEIVERISSFGSITNGCFSDHDAEHRLIRATYRELDAGGKTGVLPLADLFLEAPPPDAPLWWIRGEQLVRGAFLPVWVPAQCVFLFANLDEPKLYSALDSTGLAAGATLDDARKRALLEIVERDAVSTMPFSPDACFTVEPDDEMTARLLNAYSATGIRVQFQDLTGDMGIPCCKAFVIAPSGDIIAGTGAGLSARQALLSALTETPFPFPGGGPSGPAMSRLIRVPMSRLPDYGTGTPHGDYVLLEQLLQANGFHPVYVNLSRKDLGIPVVRALVPGLDARSGPDPLSRVHPRLYANYLRLFSNETN